MPKLLNQHKILEELKKSSNNFVKFVNDICLKDGIETAISALKLSNLCYHPLYKLTNDCQKTYNDCIDSLLEINADYEPLLSKLNNEIKYLKIIFKDFNDLRESSGVNCIPESLKITSFLISLEMVILVYFKLLEGEDLSKLKETIPLTNFLFPNVQHVDSVALSNSSVIERLDNIIEYSGDIVKYFYHLGIDSIDISSEFDNKFLEISFSHLLLFDKWTVLLTLYDNWKYFNWTIDENENNKYEFNPIDSDAYFQFLITIERYRNRRVQFQLELTNDLPSLPAIEKSKILAYAYWEIFIGTNNFSEEINGLSIKTWIDGYLILKEIVEKQKLELVQKRTTLRDWLITIERNELKRRFIKNKIEINKAEALINGLLFSNDSNDLMDTPILQKDNYFVILPSIVNVIDPSVTLFSNLNYKKSNLSFRGEKFENRLKDIFISIGIKCKKLYRKISNTEYECDLVVYLDKSFIFIECKAFIQPSKLDKFYDLQYKLYESVEQLDRIVNFYMNDLKYVKNELGINMETRIEKILKIVVTTSMIGKALQIADTHIIDESSFTRFLRRQPCGIKGNKESIVFYDSNYDGEITMQKLLGFLQKNPQIEYTNIMSPIKSMEFKLNKINIKYYTRIQEIHSYMFEKNNEEI